VRLWWLRKKEGESDSGWKRASGNRDATAGKEHEVGWTSWIMVLRGIGWVILLAGTGNRFGSVKGVGKINEEIKKNREGNSLRRSVSTRVSHPKRIGGNSKKEERGPWEKVCSGGPQEDHGRPRGGGLKGKGFGFKKLMYALLSRLVVRGWESVDKLGNGGTESKKVQANRNKGAHKQRS